MLFIELRKRWWLQLTQLRVILSDLPLSNFIVWTKTSFGEINWIQRQTLFFKFVFIGFETRQGHLN